ncbi:MAG: hypothetical protein OHK0023_07960 [Anaerolineae bacterium]
MNLPFALGIDSFTYHRWFGECSEWEPPLDIRWTTEDFLARAHEHGLQHVSLQTAYLGNLTEDTAAVKRLREMLARYQLTPVLAWGHPDGLQGGESPERMHDALAWLEVAAQLGCRIMRVVGGNQFYWARPAEPRIQTLIPQLQQLCQQATRFNITICQENHADFNALHLKRILHGVAMPNFGICFDSGNAARVGDDPIAVVNLLGAHIRMVHLKDLVLMPESRGHPEKWHPGAPLGRGEIDVRGVLEALITVGYRGTLYLEFPNMHTDFPNEDAAVCESIHFVQTLEGLDDAHQQS